MSWNLLPDHPVLRSLGGAKYEVTTPKPGQKPIAVTGTPCRPADRVIADMVAGIHEDPGARIGELLAARRRQFGGGEALLPADDGDDDDPDDGAAPRARRIPTDIKKHVADTRKLLASEEALRALKMRAINNVESFFL